MAHKLTRRDFMRATSIASVGLGGALLVGCAPKAEPTAAPAPAAPAAPKQEAPTQAAAPTEQPKPAAQEPVTLILHMRAGGETSEAPIYVERPGEFMEENPNIKVELGPIPGNEYETKIQTMAAAGTIGDALFANCYLAYQRRLIRQGVLATSDEYMDAAGISKDEWLPAAVETISLDGKMYGFPKGSHPGEVFLYINENMFQDAGLDVPDIQGNNTDDLAQWAETLAQGPESDRQVYGYFFGVGHFHAFSTPVRSFGSYLNNEEGTESLIDNAEWYAWAQYTNNFYRQNLTPHAETLPSGGADALFVAQKVPMYRAARSTWNKLVAAVKEAGDPFVMKTIQLPRTDIAKGWPSNADVHAATKSSKHPDEAFQLVHALADKRFAELVIKGIGYLTARLDDEQTLQEVDVSDDQRAFLDLQYKCQYEEEALHLPANTRGSEVATTYINEFQSVWLGDRELTQDVMNEIKGKVDEVLAKPM